MKLETDSSLLGLRSRTIELPAYSGPLDLLLRLIRKNEIDIYDIPIATITEQYLAELEAMERRDLLLAGDFLLMAATLMEIKSAMMLPAPPREDGEEPLDPRAELVERLLEYQAFQAAGEELSRLEGRRRLLFERPFVLSALVEFQPQTPRVANLDLNVLCRSFQAVLQRLDEREPAPGALARETTPLRLRLAELVGTLAAAGKGGRLLEELVQPERGRIFVIVSFLALLELLRAGRITFQPTSARESHRFWLTRTLPVEAELK